MDTRQRGFTLVEALVALALITVISLIVIGALTPWLGLKQKVDTERKLQDLKQGLTAYYDDNAMAIEAQGSGLLGPFVTSAVNAEGSCVEQQAAFSAAASKFSEAPQQIMKDGYANPWCILVSPPFSAMRDGTLLWYRNIAVVSTGRDGRIDVGTGLDAQGNLRNNGDDVGVIVSGYDIQANKLKEARRRMSRIADMYETYFTTRFIAYADRDISRYYFSTAYDTSGNVPSTNGAWQPASTTLASLGVAGVDAVSPWESANAIEVGNHNEQVSGLQVKSPATTGTGNLPFTALLRTRLPAPAGQALYATQVVVGNY